METNKDELMFIDCVFDDGDGFVAVQPTFGYRDNKTFIMAYAQAWAVYSQSHHSSAHIYPGMLAAMMEHYAIRTNDGRKYKYNSRGPFNLIRAAYKQAERWRDHISAVLKGDEQNDESNEFNVAAIAHWNNIMELIAVIYVNVDGRPAWE